METGLIVLAIAFIVVYAIDVVKFIPTLLSRVYSLLFNKEVAADKVKLPYILQCSLCCTTWVVLLFMLLTIPFTFKNVIISIVVALVAGYSTTYIYMGIDLVNKLIINLICLVDRIISKLG